MQLSLLIPTMALQARLQGLTGWERDREKDRAIQKCLDSELRDHEKIISHDIDDYLPRWFLHFAQYTAIFLFGVILLLAICALSFYITDQLSATFDGEFIEYLDYFCGSLCGLVVIASFIGCFTAFKFDAFDLETNKLRDRVAELDSDIAEFEELVAMLSRDEEAAKRTLTKLQQQKRALFSTVEKFDKFTFDFDDKANSEEFAKQVEHAAQDLFAEYEYIKFQYEKAQLLMAFYRQDADGDGGLSRAEFEKLRYDLDDHIRERFPEFELFDRDGNGVVDILEFEENLDGVYRDIFQRDEMKRRKVGAHYNRDNNIDNNVLQDKRERTKLIRTEKDRIGVRILMLD